MEFERYFDTLKHLGKMYAEMNFFYKNNGYSVPPRPRPNQARTTKWLIMSDCAF